MNILMYFGNQLNPESGGTERVACLISCALQEYGYNLFYLSCFPNYRKGSFKSFFLPQNTENATEENIQYVLNLIEENQIDIVINEGGNSDAIFLFSHEYIPKNVRIITHLHFDIYGDIEAFYQSQNLPLLNVPLDIAAKNLLKWCKMPYNRYRAIRWKKARYDYMYRQSDYIVLLSEQHVQQYIKLINCDGSKLRAITNPISYLANDVSAVKDNTVLYVGRLDYPKRVDRILQVWSNLQNYHAEWKLFIVGDGPDKYRLERLSKQMGLMRIQFVGQTDPGKYYQMAKILLMTSNYEGTPMVIYEAMAYGVVPIVMNTFPGAMSMISNNINGIITKRFDDRDMSLCCSRLMDDAEQWQHMSHNALDKMKNINNEDLLSPWIALLRQ